MHDQVAHPFGLQHAGPVRSDEPQGIAVVEVDAPAVEREGQQRVRVLGGGSVEHRSAVPPVGLEGRDLGDGVGSGRVGRASARRVVVALAPTWTTRAPMVIHAAQKWAAVKKNGIGEYQRAMFAVPVNTMNRLPPTRGTRLIRSTAWARSATGG